jgi:hypothetical protein
MKSLEDKQRVAQAGNQPVNLLAAQLELPT